MNIKGYDMFLRFGKNGAKIASSVVRRLLYKDKTVCFAESCTGGLATCTLLGVPGASSVLHESYITYSDSAKKKILGVSEDTLALHGAVSKKCAVEMALNARRIADADYGVSITGYAGPSSNGENRVGVVFIAISRRRRTIVREYKFKGDRNKIRRMAALESLSMLDNELRNVEG